MNHRQFNERQGFCTIDEHSFAPRAPAVGFADLGKVEKALRYFAEKRLAAKFIVYKRDAPDQSQR